MNQRISKTGYYVEIPTSRREFISHCAYAGWGLCTTGLLGQLTLGATQKKTTYKEAMFYEKLSGQRTRCLMCPNRCERKNGGVGRCKTRQNINENTTPWYMASPTSSPWTRSKNYPSIIFR